MIKFKTKVEKKDKGVVFVDVAIDFKEVEKKKDDALKKVAKDVKIDGFREGKVPADILKKQIGEQAILQEASQLVINEVFPEILKKEKLHMLGYPAISVTKLAVGNDFEFKIELTVYPEIKLPDYQKIVAKIKKDKVEVIDDDFKKVEENILNIYNRQQQVPAHSCNDENCQEDHTKEKDSKDNQKKSDKKTTKKATKLTDEIVKTFGPFKSVADFREQMKADLQREKEMQVIGNHRQKIVEAILEKTEFSVPEILINVELDKMIAYMKDEVMKHGIKWGDYLKNMKKDEADLRNENKDEAVKRAKFDVILKEIFQAEKMKVDEQETKRQIEQIKKIHPDAEEQNIKIYVENILMNEQVMKFLESQSEKKKKK